MIKYTVYCTSNIITKEIYIGVHKTREPNDDYLGSGKRIQNAIKKYGIENFKKEILFIFDDAETAYRKEAELVNEEFINRKDTYNLKLGGKGGWDHFLDFQSRNEKVSKVRDYSSNEYINKLSANATRVNRKMGSKCFGGKRDGFKGKTHTPEVRKRISSKLKGKTSSTKGRMWIHNLELKRAIMIYPEEFSVYETKGWIKGNKRKFS